MTVESDFPPGVAARSAALSVLSSVLRKRRPLDAAMDELVSTQLPGRDQGFARAIASETLRRLGQLDALLREFVAKTPPPHRAGPTLEILLAGACELLFLRVSPHAAVDAANRLATRDSKAVHFKPLINATLRRIAREGAEVVARQDAERLNTADWLWTRWCENYREERVRVIARAHATTPPLDLTTKSADAAAAFGEGARTLGGQTVRLVDPGAIESLPGYGEGSWWVQDFAATLPVRLFGDVRGKTVIDLCAAPGGKTAQLAQAGANVIAVEREAQRLARLEDNLERLRLSANLVEGDVRDYVPAERAPCVLLDAPCSSTGTIRRHPELPWIKSAADVNACSQTAYDLLNAAAEMVMPGGVLVFGVCSLEDEECRTQVADFLHRREDFQRIPVTPADVFGLTDLVTAEGDLRTLPCHLADEGGMDGFYAARLNRLS